MTAGDGDSQRFYNFLIFKTNFIQIFFDSFRYDKLSPFINSVFQDLIDYTFLGYNSDHIFPTIITPLVGTQ